MSDEKIVAITPQFERHPDADEPANPPESLDEWEALREADPEKLQALGMRRWADDLWLFPGEWFDAIPEGFEVTTILDETLKFDPEQQSRDIRFGCLAYGVEINGGNR